MKASDLVRRFGSPRTTIGLLVVLALLLFLSVLLPQRPIMGDEAWAALEGEAGVSRWILVDLGFGEMSTSPVFLAVLVLFFANLAVVVGSRLAPTWRRLRAKPRAEKGLIAWARSGEGREALLPESFTVREVVRTLRGFGYRVRRAGERTFWGVKHRTAPIGFLLFHLSFFLLCAGGVAIYYTRFVGQVWLSEGQTFDGSYAEVHRSPLLGGPPPLTFTLERVEPVFEGGATVQLGARLRFGQGPSSVVKDARVNHPASWGNADVLVSRAGLSPVVWLQDETGATVDRVVAPVRTRAEEGTDVPLEGGRFTLRVHPLGRDGTFPSRAELSRTALHCEIHRDGEILAAARLAPGQALAFEDRRLVLEELRYWMGGIVVAERGGALLILGFVLGTIGLIWRLPLCRREIVLHWDDGRFWLVGRSEYFTRRFDEELDGICGMLSRAETTDGAAPSGGDAT